MAITIDWNTRVINVPKADLSIIQSTPEIREMDLDWFRLQLKDIEDDAEGMAEIDTHRHSTEVAIGGVTLARTIEIINGYAITFEDGEYSVNLVGANSNIIEVANPNGVSIRSWNSAGLAYPSNFSIPAVAGAVWDEPLSTHVESGSFGEKVGKKLLTVAKFVGLK
jgi:hypothetical protein